MRKIYLDHASSMPVDPRILDFVGPFLKSGFGNPSSLHSMGLGAQRAIEDAREKVARLINAENEDCIIFTSGATESNNLAIKGTALRNIGKGKKVAMGAIEHISVLNSMKELLKSGFELGIISVDSTGIVDIERINAILTKDTTLTSIMYANNEIGTIEPIREISEAVHEKCLYLHVDATAAAGRIPIDVQKDGIDLLTLSSNDMYGPQGAGALYIKPGVKLQPILLGGGQERGLRSGTENLFAILGMGEAAKIMKNEMKQESERVREIRDKLVEEILKIEEAYLTGHPSQRLPNHASFRFSRIEGESILLNMDMKYNIQVSTGSACSSKTLEPSHVLLAIGLKHEEAHGSMVLTLGRSNNIGEIPMISKAVKETVERLRELSPL
ncbi:MAG: cysteine desulfurase family protein [Methanocellales archaeon]|nr:cysteine desulfurase family protein [Methanocellales archaeon]MDD3420752.1 cysteine desulfurase family protein [Methanocellales archaeon]MDD4898328.1 cysteine desulfurase family protein [Methanocellales archaeon]MDD5446306.1 cysteine desulfurase family protein [Methanocellales archaeon]